MHLIFGSRQRERDRDRERETERDREGERGRERSVGKAMRDVNVVNVSLALNRL